MSTAFQTVEMKRPTDATTTTKTLVRKLAEVMAVVERIPKRGRNNFHNYDYATEADIAATVRAELAARHVMLIPAITGESRHPVGEKGSVLTVLEMEMEFLDGESGESIRKPWRGYGTDKEDKGGYKAMTGGEKYFLLKSFLMPTGDDPEDDATAHPQASPTRRGGEAKKPAAPRPAPAAARPEPLVEQLDGDLPDGRVTIASVKVKKEGTSKNGKPFKIYSVVDSNGVSYDTFSDSLAKLAIHCREARLSVELRYETDKYGHNLVEIITPREPGEDG